MLKRAIIKKKPKRIFKKNEAIKKKALTYGHKKEQIKCHKKKGEWKGHQQKKEKKRSHGIKNVYDYLQSFAIALQLTTS